MTLTAATAAMTLATANEILSTPEKGWSASQVARARVISAMWKARRAAQAAKRKG